MPATERDDDRWQRALAGIQEVSAQYLMLVRSMQSGFNAVGTELDQISKQLAHQQKIQLWLLIINALNMIGWLSVIALLIYTVTRLFSVS